MSKFVVYNLRETYHELGEYEFKVVLNPDTFKNSHDCDVTFTDSDGRPMSGSVRRWGRKMNCSFRVDEGVADGVARAGLVLRDQQGGTHQGQVTFWVIKP